MKIKSARGGRGLIPRRLRRFIAFIDTPLLCGGVVHFADIFQELLK
jgi:hypothetical protein